MSHKQAISLGVIIPTVWAVTLTINLGLALITILRGAL